NRLGAETGIPREASEAVEIGHRQRATEPVRIHADVRNTHKPSDRAMEHSARHQILHRRRISCNSHIKIKNLFPHRNEKAEMALLACVFLRDLELDGFVCTV